jgi:hypothetical protein
MKTNLTLLNTITSFRQEPTSARENTVYGRVLDIILDESHKDYKSRGGLRAINGIYYDKIDDTYSTSQEDRTDFAYQGERYFQRIPKVGEIVRLESQPTTQVGLDGVIGVTYYTGIVNLWNHPKDSLAFDPRKDGNVNLPLEEEFNQDLIPNPVKSFQGDIHILGRQGQSVRFTGANSRANTLVDALNKDKPLTIIRTGGPSEDVPFQTISEDVNRDFSSIYLTSDHQIPLKPVRPFTRSLKDTKIIAPQDFRGEQILVNTGRVVLNAKESDILLYGEKSIGLNGNTVNLQAQDHIGLDAKKIYLGQGAINAIQPEPAVLGNNLELLLKTTLNLLSSLAKDLTRAVTVDGKPIPVLQQRGAQMLPQLSQLSQQLASIKSNKIFVE